MCNAGCLKPHLHVCEIFPSPWLLKTKGFLRVWLAPSKWRSWETGSSFGNVLLKWGDYSSPTRYNPSVTVSPACCNSPCKSAQCPDPEENLRALSFPVLADGCDCLLDGNGFVYAAGGDLPTHHTQPHSQAVSHMKKSVHCKHLKIIFFLSLCFNLFLTFVGFLSVSPLSRLFPSSGRHWHWILMRKYLV